MRVVAVFVYLNRNIFAWIAAWDPVHCTKKLVSSFFLLDIGCLMILENYTVCKIHLNWFLYSITELVNRTFCIRHLLLQMLKEMQLHLQSEPFARKLVYWEWSQCHDQNHGQLWLQSHLCLNSSCCLYTSPDKSSNYFRIKSLFPCTNHVDFWYLPDSKRHNLLHLDRDLMQQIHPHHWLLPQTHRSHIVHLHFFISNA